YPPRTPENALPPITAENPRTNRVFPPESFLPGLGAVESPRELSETRPSAKTTPRPPPPATPKQTAPAAPPRAMRPQMPPHLAASTVATPQVLIRTNRSC